ncbi:F0F1 ATP synthase subunit B [Candidatus Gottesmanbacteria bacterium]|nr:F0F1 ATP synthase subunit B [Candidatus Gottesmanbacteria bacterium]
MEKLGIEPILLLTQVINFSILVIVLTKFLYKPILKMLDERKRKIEEGLALSREMATKKEELDRDREKVLDRAKNEGAKIIEEYKAQAKKMEAEIIASANEEAKRLKEKAKTDQEEEKKKMWSDLRKQLFILALEMSRKVVGEVLNDKAQRLILERKLKLLESEKRENVN